MNTYTFMNKNTELFDIEMDGGLTYSISNRRDTNQHLLPVFMTQHVSHRQFNEWWQNRRIPASRYRIRDALNELNMTADHLAEKALGLSLSDQYWIRPDESVTWDSVNFFTNTFSEDIGRLLINKEWNCGSLISPDNTSDGIVPKKWKLIGNKRVLLKGGNSSVVLQPQPFREVFASRVAKLLCGKKYTVDYYTIREGERTFSMCENFVTPDTEYVSFNQINEGYGWTRPNSQSHFSWCREFFKEDAHVLDATILLDYLVLNEDRHFGNFGLLRDVTTGEFLEAAPIFDTGNSLFYDTQILNTQHLEAKPFNKSFDKQIKFIEIDAFRDQLQQLYEKLPEYFWDSFDGCYEDENRLQKIYSIVETRLSRLE